MKLRYYMRGLGIGIAITAVIMSVALHAKLKPMSDQEVIARAKELGMEEKYNSAVLADSLSGNDVNAQAGDGEQKLPAANEQTEQQTKNKEAEDALERAQKEIEDSKQAAEKAREDAAAAGAEAAVIDTDVGTIGLHGGEEAASAAQTQGIEVTVGGGDGSLTVAKKLEQAGVIADAAAFDRYLCQKGYDKRICTGAHIFAEGATEEEIAGELMRKVK